MNVHTNDKELRDLLTANYVSPNEVKRLIVKYKKEKNESLRQNLRDEIFKNNIRMIRKLACRKAKAFDVDVEDLFMAGITGFYEGLDKYVPKRKYRFTTYIGFWILKGIYEFLYANNIVFIPRSQFNKYYKKRRYQVEAAFNHNLLSLNYTPDGNEEQNRVFAPSKMVDTKVLNPEEVLSKIDLNEKLNLLMEDILDPRELVIIQHRFLKLKPSSLKELGDLTGYTRERIRQIQRVALGKLKKHWKQGRL